MHQNCEECLEIFCQKIYQFINILIDLVFGFFHLFAKDEDWHIRMASAVKFIAAAFFSTCDIFQSFCPCFCCCSKKKSELDKKIKELNKDIQKLKKENEILKEIQKCEAKEKEKFKIVQQKLSYIRKLKEENENIQIQIVSC